MACAATWRARTKVPLPATGAPSTLADMPFRTTRRVGAVLASLALLSVLAADTASARDGRDGERVEVRVAGTCSGGVTSQLRLRADDDAIELEFEVDQDRAGTVWRVALVHERRVAWKGVVRTVRPSGSFDVERRLRDLPGADAVTARAWGPRGAVCRATATLPATE